MNGDKPQYIDVVIRDVDMGAVESLAKGLGIFEYQIVLSEHKRVYQIPLEATIWHRNVFDQISTAFGKNAYFGLAYVSVENKLVVDNEGERVDSYSVLINGVRMNKWVKKSLYIVDVLESKIDNYTRHWVNVVGWKFDGREDPPIVKVLDMKSLEEGFMSYKFTTPALMERILYSCRKILKGGDTYGDGKGYVQ